MLPGLAGCVGGLGVNAPPVGKSFSFNGTSNYMELGSPAVTTTPCTFAAWFNASALVDAQQVVTVGGSTARLGINDSGTATDKMAAYTNNTTLTQRVANAPTTYSTGAWYHVAGVFASDTSRTCYQDGVAGTANTLSHTLTTVTKTTIGMRYSSGSRGQFFSGKIAHVAIWNIALSDAEIASLATPGTLPSSIQSGNLVFYAALTGGVAVDSVSATALTVSGATSSTDGPF
jgi:hypothetical protein